MMKKILALMLACTMIVGSTVCAFASESESTGSKSPSAQELQKQIEELQKQIEEMTETMNKQTEKINEQAGTISEQSGTISDQAETISEQSGTINDQAEKIKEKNATIVDQHKRIQNLTSAVTASQSGGGSSSGQSASNAALTRNNAVTYGSNTISQGGHVEINGGKSSITFLIAVPDAATSSSAVTLANSLKGTLLNVVTVSSPVAFRTATVNFTISGVTAGDTIAVYQVQNGKWVQLPTTEIRLNHVVVTMSQVGPVAFIRVPVLAMATN